MTMPDMGGYLRAVNFQTLHEMKLKALLSATLVAFSTASFAQNWQVDSVAMGAGYANDVFYDLGTGATHLAQGTDWHLAFQMTSFGEKDFNASIRASHAKKNLMIYSLNRRATSDFAGIGPADTVGKTDPSRRLYNNDSSWGEGAFSQNRNRVDAFNYGWGMYSGPSGDHSLTGDSVYLIQAYVIDPVTRALAPGNAWKLWIQKYVSTPKDSIRYTFRIAKLNGSDDRTVSINRQTQGGDMFTDRLFAYYNIDSNRILNREPSRQSWNMLFTQYYQLLQAGPSVYATAVTGVLENQGLEVADVRQVDVESAVYTAYARNTRIDEIGYDWKTYMPATFSYKMADSTSFFIKTKAAGVTSYYQLQFLRFDGGTPPATGKIVFRKRMIASLGVSGVAAQAVSNWTIAPNPAQNEAQIMMDVKTATNAQLVITDMAGRVVKTTSLSLKQGMNAFSLSTGAWPAGMYAVQIAGGDWKMSTRLAVAH